MSAEPTYDVELDSSPAGNDGAFDELFRVFHPRLVRYCRFRTGDEALAEDVAQEVLLRAYRNRADFDPSRPLWPWLKVVANNLVVDHARRREREARLCAAVSEEAEITFAEDVLQWLDERPVLRQAMSALPARQRTALSLRYVNEWSLSEAAAELEMSAPAFKQLLLRARRALSCEYRRLNGPDRRVAGLLPIFLLPRLRGRMVRLAGWFGQVSTSTVVITADAAATLAIVVALTGVVAVDVAQAALRPFSAAPTSAAIDTTEVAAFRQRITASPTVSVPAPLTRKIRQPAPAAGAAANRTAAVAAVRIDTDETVAGLSISPDLPVASERKPRADAEVKRDDDALNVTHVLEAATSGTGVPRSGEASGASGDLEVRCDTEVRDAVCDVAQTGIEAAAEVPTP